ncbi:replicative DNA helicase [Microvirga zambiensis]|uniref:replicative DNA helicase n=1 Tax=Microvirga zambiensis TaxID=1402137 RepID=UPI00191D4A2F|nr:DnaB-like helicase C-terminal domain-containing protein [Microvirga zambiensis]
MMAQADQDRWAESLKLAFDAEQGLLGCLLINPESYGLASSLVKPEYFTEPLHRKVYEAMAECRRAGRKGSLGELRHALGATALSQDLGGGVTITDYLGRLRDDGTTHLSVSDYARTVRDYWAIRCLIATASVDMAGLPENLLKTAFDKLDTLRMEISDATGTRESIGSIGADVLARAERIADGEEEEPGATTGLPDLDRAMLGYRPGELIIVAGRPGMGKSTFGTSSALATANVTRDGRHCGVGYFALELGREAIGARCLADLAYERANSPTHSAIRGGQIDRYDRDLLHRASQDLQGRALEIDGRSVATVGEIEATCRAMQRRFERQGSRLGVVFIDYLKNVTASDRYRGQRVYEVGEITTGLRDIAKRLGICVVLLVQLNRGVEGRDDKRPTLADLRESGDIENDADVVLMLYRHAYYLRRDMRAADPAQQAALMHELTECENKLEIIIPKNRNGEGEQTIHVFCDIGRSAIRPLARHQ